MANTPLKDRLPAGTYNPTITNGANVAASTTGPCSYMYSNKTLTIGGQISIDLSAAGSFDLSITLPPGYTNTVSGLFEGGGSACEYSAASGGSAGLIPGSNLIAWRGTCSNTANLVWGFLIVLTVD